MIGRAQIEGRYIVLKYLTKLIPNLIPNLILKSTLRYLEWLTSISCILQPAGRVPVI